MQRKLNKIYNETLVRRQPRDVQYYIPVPSYSYITVLRNMIPESPPNAWLKVTVFVQYHFYTIFI